MKSLIKIFSFGLLLASAGPVSALTFDSNVPDDIKTQTVSDMNFVEGIAGPQQSPLNLKIFKSFSGKAYMNWFSDRIEDFGYDPSTNSGAIAYNNSQFKPKQMLVTDYFVKGDLPLVARIQVLFHEARHSEADQNYWLHNICPNPFRDKDGQDIKSIFSGLPLAGKDGCDNTSRGAYGISVVLTRNIERFCETCSEKVKMDAKIYSDDQTKRILMQKYGEALAKDASETASTN